MGLSYLSSVLSGKERGEVKGEGGGKKESRPLAPGPGGASRHPGT